MFGRKKKIKITLSNYEYHLILDCLISLRNELIEQGRYTDGVDETLVAIAK